MLDKSWFFIGTKHGLIVPIFYQFSIIYQHTANNNPTWCQCRTNFGPRCCQFVLMRTKFTYCQVPPNVKLPTFIQCYVKLLSLFRQDYANRSPIYIQDVANMSVPKAIFILDQDKKSNKITPMQHDATYIGPTLVMKFLRGVSYRYFV